MVVIVFSVPWKGGRSIPPIDELLSPMAPRSPRRFRPALHPRAGIKLPPELRAGSVGRIARTLPLGVEDPGFELLLRRIDRGPILGGNRIEVFTRGAEA